MRDHNITPSSSDGTNGNKDNQSQGLNPAFDFDRYNITPESRITQTEFLEHTREIIQQGNHTLSKQLNRFPVEVFPSPIQQIINSTHKCLNFPIDFIGSSILYAASVSIGNTHRVEVKKGWAESPVLYMAIVGRAGTNKSHPLSFAIQPIVEEDKRTHKQYERQRLEYESIVSLSKKEREQQGIEEPVKPVWKKFLLSDFTPEALAEVHQHNKRGIGVYADELAGWFKNFNLYNKGSEMEFWLSAWNSKPINIDRKSGEPVFIPLPFISVCGTIQNGILNELAKDNRTENGFIERILFVIPSDLQKEYWSENELRPDISENWNTILSNLLSLSITKDETLNPCPEVLVFTPDAKRLLWEWQKVNTDESNDADDDAVRGICSKMEMYAPRLALILEMLMYACQQSSGQSISIEAVEGALKLVEYFKNSAFKVQSIVSNTNPLDNYPADKQTVYNALPEIFKTQTGVQTAERLGMPERTFHRFLNDRELFIQRARGEYEKRI